MVLTLTGQALGRGIFSPFQQHLLDSPGCDGTGIVDPDSDCKGDGIVPNPSHGDRDRDGFQFENPSLDCEYASQPYIWDSFKDLEKDMSKLFTVIHKNVSFTINGHHPVSGHYHDLMHFYVNALRRVSVCLSEHQDKFRILPQAIHGGCNNPWSVQEVRFLGQMNSGDIFDVINVWVTRWHKGQMVEIRTFTDSAPVIEVLQKNEIWWNSSTWTDHTQFIPGPSGMPDLSLLEGLMRYPDGSRYED
ncbi:hypothetical protein UA08_07380 [Talaromyces atroroseus]|uniref:Uncharacterized protein n=1 Tax=Talaromyces atroroseus TaxID=1441469 RepID=A0A225AJA6_TALAT|nr:hypothetical protein UA08_07380 [Talaromyces atroroseus]OKL57228.1 hypothetical protein UA08_07380 [Talaromyces atroroseus]